MLSWERNREFQVTEKILAQYEIVDFKTRVILNEAAFEDLLFGLFAAWALKAIGREKYVLFFHPLDATHTLLSVQRAPSPALRPSRRNGLYAADFWQAPTDLRALQGKLLYNAGIAPEVGLLDEIDLKSLNSPAALRAFVVDETLRDVARYGWLWGGQSLMLRVPPPVFQGMLTAAKRTRHLLCESFEQILCLHLGLRSSSSFFSCHLQQTAPIRFSEADILLCRVAEQSKTAGLWTLECGRDLKDEVGQDRVFVLENSSGVTEPESSERSGEPDDEPESRWHPKIINWLALRQIGFSAVRLHMCSLVPMKIDNEALAFALERDPQISRHHPDHALSKSIRDATWTPTSLRAAFHDYCQAALQSAAHVMDAPS